MENAIKRLRPAELDVLMRGETDAEGDDPQ
jgi:hypothetical protein